MAATQVVLYFDRQEDALLFNPGEKFSYTTYGYWGK